LLLLWMRFNRTASWLQIFKSLASYTAGLMIPFWLYIIFIHYPAADTFQYNYGFGVHMVGHWERIDHGLGRRTFPDPSHGPASGRFYKFVSHPRAVSRIDGSAMEVWSLLALPRGFLSLNSGQMSVNPWFLEYYVVFGFERANRWLVNAVLEHDRAHPVLFLKF